MKERFNQLFSYIKTHKKKSLLIGGAALLLIAAVIAVTVFLVKANGRTASAGNVASGAELKKSEAATKQTNETYTNENTTNNESSVSETINTQPNNNDNNTDATDQGENAGQSQNGQTASGSYYGPLKVTGTSLTDASGNPVQLKGISTHGIGWFPDYINNECFKELHENFGVNVIRLAMYTAEYNGYCTGGDQNYLKGLVDNGVQYATDNNMYAIIDWHILSDGNPNTYLAQSKEFFAEMASKYASNDHVIYEICNEPNGGTSWSDIKNYAEEVIGVIRQYDADAVIIVGTPNWSQYVDQAAADPITDYSNVMYALHFYAATHKDSLRNTMTSALDAGLPIFVTEFGICDASGNGGIDEDQSAQWISLMNSRGVSYVMWNLSNKGETSAIINSSCTKKNGFGLEDLSAAGQWFVKMMTGGLNLPEPTGGSSNSSSGSGQGSSSNTGSGSDAGSNGNGTSNGNNNGNQNHATVSVSANMVNSWQADGKTFYQYDVTVSNNSGADCGSWSADLSFNENIGVSNSWNGNFSVSGSTVHISSTDYNGGLANGASIGNIGLIVSGSGNLRVR